MADTSVKLSGTYDSIEAYNILEEMRNMSADYEEIRTEAAAAASVATAAVTTAQTAANSASTYAGNAQTYAGNANTSAGEAAGYASDASTSATNAASSETNASNSASAAATSAANAAASEAVVAGALPLSGGTMTGEIVRNGFVIVNSVDNSYTEYLGGKDETGSYLVLYGKNHLNSPGRINIRANNGTNSSYLTLDPNGSATWGGKKISTSNWKIENVTLSLSGASIKSWGFCHIAYNENVAILSISGLVVGRTISQDTVLCYLPVTSLMSVYAPVHNMSNGSTIAHAVVSSNYVNLNAISNATDSHAFSIVFPIA